MVIPASELVLNTKGEIYHLGLLPEDISDKIILVGDQNRVQVVANQFDEILVHKNHREFHTIKGIYKGVEITVISTGIGTDNIDIVINELDALANINLNTREINKDIRSLELLRIGTCGIFQESIPLHSYLLSIGSFGLDNVAHFYQNTFSKKEESLAKTFKKTVNLPTEIIPYYAEASSKILSYFEPLSQDVVKGFTVTSSGFYGPQGRTLRLELATTKMKSSFENIIIDGVPIVNFEMESSALFALSNSLGHHAGCICLGIANRIDNTFSTDYNKAMQRMITHVLNHFL